MGWDSVPDIGKAKANSDVAQTLRIDGSRRSRFRSLEWLGCGIAVLVILG